MSKYAALLGLVTIDSSKLAIRMKENATTATVSIVAGAYTLRGDGAADDLCLAIKTALDSHSNATTPNTYSVTLACSVDPASPTATITISRLTGSSTFQFLWADALTTFPVALIGVAAVNTADDATDKVSTLSPSALWISPDVMTSYEPGEEYDATASRAKPGTVGGLLLGVAHDVRRPVFRFQDSRRVLDWDNTTDPNAAFSSFLERHGDGKAMEFHEVGLLSGSTLRPLTSSTIIGSSWNFAEETVTEFTPERISPGLALYSFDVKLLGQNDPAPTANEPDEPILTDMTHWSEADDTFIDEGSTGYYDNKAAWTFSEGATPNVRSVLRFDDNATNVFVASVVNGKRGYVGIQTSNGLKNRTSGGYTGANTRSQDIYASGALTIQWLAKFREMPTNSKSAMQMAYASSGVPGSLFFATGVSAPTLRAMTSLGVGGNMFSTVGDPIHLITVRISGGNFNIYIDDDFTSAVATVALGAAVLGTGIAWGQPGGNAPAGISTAPVHLALLTYNRTLTNAECLWNVDYFRSAARYGAAAF